MHIMTLNASVVGNKASVAGNKKEEVLDNYLFDFVCSSIHGRSEGIITS